MDEIGKSVRAIIALQLKIDSRELADDVEFVADLGLDSLDSIEIVIALEEYFDLEISDQDCRDLSCVADVIACITARCLESLQLPFR